MRESDIMTKEWPLLLAPKLLMLLLSGAILALLTGLLGVCCLAAIVLLAIGFLCTRREPTIVFTLLHLGLSVSRKVNRNEAEASELKQLRESFPQGCYVTASIFNIMAPYKVMQNAMFMID